ncbi:hypothetical protein OSTOST_06851 [Ostertagia ostertagi]
MESLGGTGRIQLETLSSGNYFDLLLKLMFYTNGNPVEDYGKDMKPTDRLNDQKRAGEKIERCNDMEEMHEQP